MPTNLEKQIAQIAMNRQTWFALQQHGAKEGMELRLDFSFNASSRKAANELFARLKAETDYDLRVESSGSFLSRKWRVEGRTQAMRVLPSALDEWVARMVQTGEQLACEFDGWGTSI